MTQRSCRRIQTSGRFHLPLKIAQVLRSFPMGAQKMPTFLPGNGVNPGRAHRDETKAALNRHSARFEKLTLTPL
jgi:hypothetical protein